VKIQTVGVHHTAVTMSVQEHSRPVRQSIPFAGDAKSDIVRVLVAAMPSLLAAIWDVSGEDAGVTAEKRELKWIG
jgi:hypothetical protein